jgi:SAM-dependent methyltransferase
METNRRKFQGVLNILSFNRHFYVLGFTALILIYVSHTIFGWSNTLYFIVVAAFIYGLAMPLIVSAYIYDFSGYYTLDWLKKLKIVDANDKLNLNINAGFDETSFIIKKIFPISELKVFDFYDANRHTEPAIIRARKVSLVYPNTQQIKSSTIPLKDHSVDNIFILSAAHEIRSHEEKVEFLKECHRICKPTGMIIVAEHLRDLPNFIAFSIGFTHFFSKEIWKKAFHSAGFSSMHETKFTPFISIFNCHY